MPRAMVVPGAPDLENEGAKLFESPAAHAAMRTFQSVGAALGAVALFQASLFVPSVARLFGVTVLQGAFASSLVVSGR
jgi:hypothetical protein